MAATKIVHLTSVHKALDVRIFAKECKSLARAGYDVVLIVPCVKDEKVDGVTIKSVPRPSGRVSRMTRTVWRVCREALRQNAVIYHFHDPELIPVGLYLSASGKKVIYDAHESYPQAILSKQYLVPWIRRPLSLLMKRFEAFAAQRCSALVGATPAITDHLREHNARVTTIQNFPLEEEIAEGGGDCWQERPAHIVYIGGISVLRGIREMVKAMELLPRGLHGTLTLAGEFCPPNLLDEVSALPGWTRVERLGFVPRRVAGQLMRGARAGLLLYLPEPNHLKSQPNKLFEYMSAGLPIIASDFPLWRAIIEEAGCGLLVDPLDPHAISQAIEHLLTNPKLGEAMGRRGRDAVEKKYNWMSEEKKLLALYEELLAEV